MCESYSTEYGDIYGRTSEFGLSLKKKKINVSPTFVSQHLECILTSKSQFKY